MIAVEDSLWLALAACLPGMIPLSWQTLALLSTSIYDLMMDRGKSSYASTPSKKGRAQATESGSQMSIVMVPALLQIIAHHYSENESQWNSYSKLATLLVIPKYSLSMVLCTIAILLDPSLDISIACFFILAWFLLVPICVENLQNSFTFGESRVVILMFLVAGAEYIEIMCEKRYGPDYPNISSLYSLVALSGSISCFFFSYLCNHLNLLSWWTKLGVNVVGPILAIDLSLYITTNVTTFDSFLPLSIQWLTKFLTEKENGSERYWGLIYWVGVLAVGTFPTFALLSVSSENKKPSVVVTRKWFHLIAVLLFGPITLRFPQLMSLSYAIAICILIVLETLRRDAPFLQSFYTAFIDNTKDDGGQIIVSHIFLIVGCAAPLWVSQILLNQKSSPSPLIMEFGVLCIGIGDAMGAAIGKSMGKHKWGKNQRTLEGSLAMWLSMTALGVFLCSSIRDCVALLVATTVTTIFEAFTVQLDNLVLPIIGTSIILLISAPSVLFKS